MNAVVFYHELPSFPVIFYIDWQALWLEYSVLRIQCSDFVSTFLCFFKITMLLVIAAFLKVDSLEGGKVLFSDKN